MKLGIVIILIGVAWCARCYLLRPKPPVVAAATQHVTIHDNDYFPRDGKLAITDYDHEPVEGESVEWIYWSAPVIPKLPEGEYGVYMGQGSKHSHAYRVFTFTKGDWTETDRYPRKQVEPHR